MTSLVDKLNSVMDTLKDEIDDALSNYKVMHFLRFPTATDFFPVCFIVPTRITPIYRGGILEEDEYAIIEIEIHLVTRVPFDYRGTRLLEDLDAIMEKLRTLRHDDSKWYELDYKGGIDLEYSPIEKWILQSAVVHVKVEA